ncbi:hypothetical protein MTR67_048501 [Solanum verrucosum]|nr:hypothetical protein MTR67_019249 [Solanum verrucosum]WMV25866.1 hypothetical protein MTR67_019251 [Solanum verrucosum]WMV55116.1 hypothetical protein MTR67_048501 [Solanum verrucosum]
MVATHGS